MSDVDLTFVETTLSRVGRSPEAVIPVLQRLMEHYRYLPQDALEYVADHSEITPAAITGVATFYTQFRLEPVGRRMISVCCGAACHVKGADDVYGGLADRLELPRGGDTTDDGEFTLQRVACLGCCTLAPVVQIGDRTFGHVSHRTVADVLRQAREMPADAKRRFRRSGRHKQRSPQELAEIRIGLGSCCVAQGSGKVRDAIANLLELHDAPAQLKRVGCVGMCHQTPLVEVAPPTRPNGARGKSQPPRLFANVRPEDAESIVRRALAPSSIAGRLQNRVTGWLDLLFAGGESGPTELAWSADGPQRDGPVCAFLGPQRRLATEYCGQIDPLDLDEYLRHGGFAAYTAALAKRPDDVIAEIETSRLRGRGGAGFPAAKKWRAVKAARGEANDNTKYAICNADEGDPGAFMDRMLLESFPYRVIEGLAIASYAVGAGEAFFYIRAEYPLAVQRIRAAIEQCESRGLIDPDRLKLSVREGAGAFVCGEETALISSLEGRRGMPRLRPPYPAERGLHGKPTLVNNVETLTLVPWIIQHGATAFTAIGTPESAGTKVFSLAGKVARGGLIEVPMGVTLRQIVEQIGGGVAGGKRLKAVQVGGPSGGCVPESLCDTPVDYEALRNVGAMMGSGGLVVLDEDDCMVDIARYFLHFTQDQSCGKCTFCRVGSRRMLEILESFCAGRADRNDLRKLEELAGVVQAGSICGLGKTAPNPVLSTLTHFREEYEAHLAGRCPAGRCKSLIHYAVTDQCVGCTLCAQVCPADAIPFTPYQRHVIDDTKCTRCDACRQVCPEKAVAVQ